MTGGSGMLLSGKNVIITGSAQGIGKMMLETFAASGANVWACARMKTDEFEANAQVLREKYQVSIWPVYFDLRDHEQLKAAAKSITATKLPVDALVNNASSFYATPIGVA